MSIAAISSSFISAVRERAPVAAVSASAPVHRDQHGGGRRHALIDAMSQALGTDAALDKSGQQAVFRFAHALMHDLRSIDDGAGREGPGQGHAWGRRNWTDLAQRIDTLATAAASNPGGAAGAATATAPAPATVTATSPTAADAAVAVTVVDAAEVATGVAVDGEAAELPQQPNPLTATSAAVHLMQVPSSRLLEAYGALREVLGHGSDAPATTEGSSLREDLAAMLRQLSGTLTPSAAATPAAGSVMHLTA